MYWHQGLQQAPATVHACIDSWRRLNPGWELVCLDQHSVGQYIGSDEPWQKLGWLGLAHRADLIRLHLLQDHGGVWADVSTLCMQPLDHWIDTALASGFFCFAAPGRDRVMSNWFMAAQPGNPLISRQLDNLTAYFCDNNFGSLGPLRLWLICKLGKRYNRSVSATRGWFSWWVRRVLKAYPYFIFHYVFARLVEEDPECRVIWQATPMISADGPHAVQRAGLFRPLDKELREAIDARRVPMYKLDWRVDPESAPAGSVLQYLFNQPAGADEEVFVSNKHLILHVGLPKTATTALQFWCDDKRAELASHGVNYPVCDADQIVPKHQYIVGELFKGEFPRTEAVLRECREPLLVLSSEGLSNHFYDFPVESLRSFRELASNLGYRVSVFLVFREPAVWLRSYYKQAVLNVRNLKFEWGTARLYEEFIQLPRVKRLTDAEALCADMASGFGGEVQLACYEDDWFGAFVERLGVADQGLGLPPRVHGSVDDGLVELVRQINGMNLASKLRDSALAACQRCFNTSHVDLAHYRLKTCFGPEIFQALQPRDETMQVMKQQLLDWHAAHMRKGLFGLGGWKLR